MGISYLFQLISFISIAAVHIYPRAEDGPWEGTSSSGTLAFKDYWILSYIIINTSLVYKTLQQNSGQMFNFLELILLSPLLESLSNVKKNSQTILPVAKYFTTDGLCSPRKHAVRNKETWNHLNLFTSEVQGRNNLKRSSCYVALHNSCVNGPLCPSVYTFKGLIHWVLILSSPKAIPKPKQYSLLSRNHEIFYL